MTLVEMCFHDKLRYRSESKCVFIIILSSSAWWNDVVKFITEFITKKILLKVRTYVRTYVIIYETIFEDMYVLVQLVLPLVPVPYVLVRINLLK